MVAGDRIIANRHPANEVASADPLIGQRQQSKVLALLLRGFFVGK